MVSSHLQTLNGKISEKDLGLILPHEHLFTDLRGPDVIDYASAEPDDVINALGSTLTKAHQAGVTALVECSTIGVGRNIDILQAISRKTPIEIIAPTGVYREAYIPGWMKEYSIEQMSDLWVEELTIGIGGADIKAGFIKIAMSDDGIRPIEKRILQAAASASMKTGAVIASHTISGEIFLEEWKILDQSGLDPENFIWVHANLEEDQKILLDAASIGVYIEFDGVGAPWQAQTKILDDTIALMEQGYLNKILLSHDAGWYQPGNPGGEPEGGYRGYTALSEEFIPSLLGRGAVEKEIVQLTHQNPVSAFGFTS